MSSYGLGSMRAIPDVLPRLSAVLILVRSIPRERGAREQQVQQDTEKN